MIGKVLGADSILDVFGPVEDTTTDIIKVVGVGGGGCNAVGNMYSDGMQNVTFAVCNTDSKSLSANPVPTKIMLGKTGHGAGADPQKGREEAEKNVEDLKRLFSDQTQMTFIVSAMGGGTGTGAGPFVAGIAKEMGLLTIGIVTLPFYFEKRPKILKALKGLDEMRANVDALLIINNEQISKVFCDSHIPVKEAFRRADSVMANAVRGISELITLNGTIQTDFADVKATMKNGGGAIMAIGRSSGKYRVHQAVLNALESPLLYGADINKANRILFNIYTSSEHELYVDELQEIDSFMEELDPSIDVIWGLSTDDTLNEDVKITILATGVESSLPTVRQKEEDISMDEIINQIYGDRDRKKTPAYKEVEPAKAPELVESETAVDEEMPASAETPSEAVLDDIVRVGETISLGREDDEEPVRVIEGAQVAPEKVLDDNSNTPVEVEDPKEPESVNNDTERPVDPSKAFFNRVRNRFLQGLSSLTKE